MENTLYWFAGASLGLLVVATISLSKLTAACARTERKLNALLQHAGIDLTAQALKESETLLKAGRKIEAIKVYRDLTGAGLADAKAAVERLQ